MPGWQGSRPNFIGSGSNCSPGGDVGRGSRILNMAELVGNLLVAQSGGPTAVINASVAGVVQEAGRHEFIEEIYGGLNGILGILNEELIDLND